MDKFLFSFHNVNHMKICINLASTAITIIPDHHIPPYFLRYLQAYSTRGLFASSFNYKLQSIYSFIQFFHLCIISTWKTSNRYRYWCFLFNYTIFSDFIEDLSTLDITSLDSLTSTDTAVVGQGQVQWDVEAFHGQRHSITTKAYLVPSGTICLFSPQVYIAENSTTSCLHLDSVGISLTLTYRTKLSFYFTTTVIFQPYWPTR